MNTITDKGTVWVCAACGKTSKSRSGFDSKGKKCSDYGWDESCMMNSVLCHDSSLKYEGGRVVSADAVKGENDE